ncbi:uncharacterized protein LAJ45_05977 [Morchella importuna]|uniref:uncharacterized protein n=1 Tax=Morchella importuna TaxID=1174673 RepID=UPI001E8D6107|nr:uncharacterized protein LAJ45_05977 [Morchella importuna]KAH8149825.1 hypothetical protein LAJ45_05977 [Morchella importuna]
MKEQVGGAKRKSGEGREEEQEGDAKDTGLISYTADQSSRRRALRRLHLLTPGTSHIHISEVDRAGGFIWGKGKQQLRREVPVLVACM